MRVRLFRVVLTLTAWAVVWLVTAPAFARQLLVSLEPPLESLPADAPSVEKLLPSSWAPLCDPRGASALAPPPQMQDVERTLDAGLTLEDCMASTSVAASHAETNRAPKVPDVRSSNEPARNGVTFGSFSLCAPRSGRVPVERPRRTRARLGFREAVERPPRVSRAV
jgi:hypothetical protein